MARIALQLYTVRENCERDFEGTLRVVAEAGDTLAVSTTVERPAYDDLAR